MSVLTVEFDDTAELSTTQRALGRNGWFRPVRAEIIRRSPGVRLFVDSTRGNPLVLRMTPREAEQIGRALIEAAESCANCGAPMNGTVRVHHHTENGQDVTRSPAA